MLFMVLSSWQSHCESSPGSFDECRVSAEVAANRLRLRVSQKEMAATVHIHHRHFIITQANSARDLILILPSHGGWKVEST